MAGEKRGGLAGAIAKVWLERAISLLGKPGEVFWEQQPLGSVIKPDLTVGSDKDNPQVLVLVNASDTARNSDIKYWRNLGEVFDSKARLQPRPSVLNLV